MTEPEEHPQFAAKPQVTTVNRKPLALVLILFGGLVLLAVMFGGRPTPRPATEASAVQEKPSLTDAFLREQQERAERVQRFSRDRSAPPVFAPPSAVPSSSRPQPELSDPQAEEDLQPGTYSPAWQGRLSSPLAPAPSLPPSTQAPGRPKVRFREGKNLDTASAGRTLEDQFADLLKDAAKVSAAPASTPGTTAPGIEGPGDKARAFLGGIETAPRRLSVLTSTPPPPSPLVVFQGTLIPATLETAISSELPGQVTALVRRDVYDSRTGTHLLLPRASRLIGEYSADVVYGERRLLIAWTRAILPDGSSYDLGAMPGTDALGAAGLDAQVHNHWLRAIGNALLLTTVSAGAQLSQPERNDNARNPTASEIAAGALGQNLANLADQSLRRDLSVRPVLTAAPGATFNIMTTRDLVFPRPYRRFEAR
jgi:type IV secretory pathway VirB10-like protein